MRECFMESFPLTPPHTLSSGKTTLADCLVASNGIISSRLAGKVVMFMVTEERLASPVFFVAYLFQCLKCVHKLILQLAQIHGQQRG